MPGAFLRAFHRKTENASLMEHTFGFDVGPESGNVVVFYAHAEPIQYVALFISKRKD